MYKYEIGLIQYLTEIKKIHKDSKKLNGGLPA